MKCENGGKPIKRTCSPIEIDFTIYFASLFIYQFDACTMEIWVCACACMGVHAITYSTCELYALSICMPILFVRATFILTLVCTAFLSVSLTHSLTRSHSSSRLPGGHSSKMRLNTVNKFQISHTWADYLVNLFELFANCLQYSIVFCSNSFLFRFQMILFEIRNFPLVFYCGEMFHILRCSLRHIPLKIHQYEITFGSSSRGGGVIIILCMIYWFLAHA